MTDLLTPEAGLLIGEVIWELFDEDGNLKAEGITHNLVTQVGDQFYGERAVGLGSLANASGMRLGNNGSPTAASKTSTGAAIQTYVTGSSQGFDGSFPASSLNGSSRRIQYKTTWTAGTATASGISEVVITCESPITNVIGSAANTIARALISPVVNKGASDTLAVTWNHDLLGA